MPEKSPIMSERRARFYHSAMFGLFIGGAVVLALWLIFLALVPCFTTIGGTFCKVGP